MSVAKSDKDDIATEVFKSKAIAVGSPTVINNVMNSVSGFISYLEELKFKNKKAAVFGCYGWSGEGNKVLRERLGEIGYKVVEPELKSNFNPTDELLSGAREVALALLK